MPLQLLFNVTYIQRIGPFHSIGRDAIVLFQDGVAFTGLSSLPWRVIHSIQKSYNGEVQTSIIKRSTGGKDDKRLVNIE
jgi:hypothetical protein